MEESEKKVKPINRAKVHITGTMCLCFAFEFCVRWTTNAYESRYGIYLSDFFGTSSLAYSSVFSAHFTRSTLIIVQSVICVVLEFWVYPWFTGKLKIPIPYLAGIGMAIAANKVHGIRCAVCNDPYSATMAHEHNDANVIVFPARFITNDEAVKMLEAFFAAEFEGGRHERRVAKIPVPKAE